MSEIRNPSWPGWEIVRKIGSGSYGSVYEIRRDVFGAVDRGALKVIQIPQSPGDIQELISEGYEEADITDRFRSYLQDITREYSLMAMLKGHPNIVYCEDLRYEPHEESIGWDIFIKMELLTPLLTALKPEDGEEVAIRLGKDIANALIACRKHNIVHRDIKPQNIFLSESGEFKLGDFGIAKTAEKTTGGTKIGTYKYMAPEVYNNQPYGATADIYSLGMVMYWLLNGRRTPFLPLPPQSPTASEEEEARRRRFTGEPIPAPLYGSDRLKAIVLKAVSYNVKDRYATAEELLDALKTLESNKESDKNDPSPSPEERQQEREPLREEEDLTLGVLKGRHHSSSGRLPGDQQKGQVPSTEDGTISPFEDKVLEKPKPQGEEPKEPVEENRVEASSIAHKENQSFLKDSENLPHKKEKEEKPDKRLRISLMSVAGGLLIVFSILLGVHLNRWQKTSATVMTVGEKEISVAEFNYFYHGIANPFRDYTAYLGIDEKTPIDRQSINAEAGSILFMLGMDTDCLEPYKQEDGSYDITWAEYFALLAGEEAARIWSVYQAAMADPYYQVSLNVENAISEEMASCQRYAQEKQFDNADKLLEYQYGKGCNRENYEEYIRVTSIATDYAHNYRVDDSIILTEYTANSEAYDVATFLLYEAAASDYEDEEAVVYAKAAAERMEKNFHVPSEDVYAYADYTRSDIGDCITSEAATWIFEEAQDGEVKLFADEEAERYYVIKLLSRNGEYRTSELMMICLPMEEAQQDTNMLDGLTHAFDTVKSWVGSIFTQNSGEETTAILVYSPWDKWADWDSRKIIQPPDFYFDSEFASEGEGGENPLPYTEKLASIVAKLEGDCSPESFRTLASQYSSSPTVDLHRLTYSTVGNKISKEALLWIMEDRQPGDYGIFHNGSDTFVLYYRSAGETYRDLSVNHILVSEWVRELTDTALSRCNFNMKKAMKGSVELIFGS